MDAIARDWRQAPLERISGRARALCRHAIELTLRPGSVGADDVRALREAGCDDRAIHDATQVIGFFNWYNRLADGLGVDAEPEWGDAEPGGDRTGPG